jgi:uncharacterized OsmC-like protein
MKDLKQLYERHVKVMTARPAMAQVKGQALARCEDGVAVAIGFGDFSMRADSPEVDGGAGTAPSPGQIMRAGLCSCLAMGYRMWGERLGVPLEGIEVDMTCELDARGQLGIADVPVGWQKIRWTVRLASDAPEAEVLRVLDHADRLSPMLASIDRGAARERTVELRRKEAP